MEEEQMSLEKKQTKECLMKKYNNTTRVEKLMKNYEELFPDYYNDKLTPFEMSVAMIAGF